MLVARRGPNQPGAPPDKSIQGRGLVGRGVEMPSYYWGPQKDSPSSYLGASRQCSLKEAPGPAVFYGGGRGGNSKAPPRPIKGSGRSLDHFAPFAGVNFLPLCRAFAHFPAGKRLASFRSSMLPTSGGPFVAVPPAKVGFDDLRQQTGRRALRAGSAPSAAKSSNHAQKARGF